jgi:hypothetical protein
VKEQRFDGKNYASKKLEEVEDGQRQQLPPESGAAQSITKLTEQQESSGTEMSCGIERGKSVVHFQVGTTPYGCQ